MSPDNSVSKFTNIQLLSTLETLFNFENNARNESGIVYHYTSLGNFYSIIQSREIWLTEAQYLNDPDEIKYFTRSLFEVISDGEWKSESLIRLKDRYNDLLNESFESGSDPSLEDPQHETYVFSTSENGDSLEQWRAYAPGNSGVCIGFDMVTLNECIIADDKCNSVRKVAYLNSSALSEKIKDVALIFDATASDFDNQTVFIHLWKRRYAGFCKNDVWKNEQEWRFSIHAPTDRKLLSYRERNGRLIPFLKQSQLDGNGNKSLLPIKKIILPYNAESLALESVRGFLEHSGYDISLIDISRSTIPISFK